LETLYFLIGGLYIGYATRTGHAGPRSEQAAVRADLHRATVVADGELFESKIGIGHGVE